MTLRGGSSRQNVGQKSDEGPGAPGHRRRKSSPAVLQGTEPCAWERPQLTLLTPTVGPVASDVEWGSDIVLGLWSDVEASLLEWDAKEALFPPLKSPGEGQSAALSEPRLRDRDELHSPNPATRFGTKAPLRIVDLPQEVLLKIMWHVEDTDLQTLAHVSRLFRALSTDPVLWIRYILFTRNPWRLRYHLSLPQRPTREQLVEANILKCGIAAVRDGVYINGPQAGVQYDARRKVWRSLVERSLGRRLAKRPTMEELREKNVLPVEAFVPIDSLANSRPQGRFVRSATVPALSGDSDDSDPTRSRMDMPSSPSPPPRICSSPLLPKVVQLSQALKKDKLKRRMEGRRILDDLREGTSVVPIASRSGAGATTGSIRMNETLHRVPASADRYYPFFYLDFKQCRRPTAPRSALADSIRSSVSFFESEARRYAPPAPAPPRHRIKSSGPI